MHAEDLNDSMPGLPGDRFKQGDKVVCVDAKHTGDSLKVGHEYIIDADYGDVKGKQLVYIVGDPDNCPYAASRFARPALVPSPSRGNPAAEFAELGMLAVRVPSSTENQQALLSGDAQKLSRTEQAVFENLMDAESRGEVANDNVNLPHHYARFKIEPIRFICENGLNFFQGNIVKYTLRHDAKNGLEDIKKAIRYAQMYFKFLSGDPDWWRAVA